MRYCFLNDYGEGAHPSILEALSTVNFQNFPGYGTDRICRQAAETLLRQTACPGGAVYFLVGGTGTNLTAISAFLRPHEAAVSAQTGHIFVHETGAVEATGHKVFAVPTKDGKLTPALVGQVLAEHTDEHMVKPRLVYISNPTELGTLYTKAELTALSAFCREAGLLLYLDGARLGAALTGRGNDLALSDLPHLTDAFYIGGTKNGALFGEALILCREELKPDFRYLIKQKGALLAKGWLLGLQFEALFRDGLYFELARHANEMARLLQDGLRRLGFDLLHPSPTNQIFPVVADALVPQLREICDFEVWSRQPSGKTAIRMVTSWATRPETVDGVLSAMEGMLESPQ